MDEKEKVLAFMKEIDKPVRPGEVAEKLELDKKLVSKIISELKKEGKVVSPKRCFYKAV